jgi:hypothetical protein
MQPADLVRHLDRLRIRRVAVVSPHLDDAAISAWSLLSSRLSTVACVFTIFTESTRDVDQAWACEAGFADTIEEHCARRQEDSRAMEKLGIDFRHLGFVPGSFSEEQAENLARRLAGLQSNPGEMLCLLPAAAGLPVALEQIWRRWSLLTGRPLGAPVHPEHRLVRDALLPQLVRSGCQLGFYCEFPYLWHDSIRRVEGRLAGLVDRPLRRFSVRVDPPAKLAIAEAYASQVAALFGPTVAERLRSLAHPEVYFLPEVAA